MINLDNYECEGQLSLFDFPKEPKNVKKIPCFREDEPKAPIWHSSLTACYVECPTCHEINHIENYHDRCPDCGQLLDQSSEAIAKAEKVSKDLQECRKKGLHGAVTKNVKGQWEEVRERTSNKC